MRSSLACCIAFLTGITPVCAQDTSDNHIDPVTFSPDGRYGITVQPSEYTGPDMDVVPVKDPENAIIEIKTGHRVGVIQGDPAFEHMNHDRLEPTCWAADDSVFLWQVDGKWGYAEEVLISLKNGKVASQIDVLKLLQDEILKRTQETVPKDYAAIKATSDGFGSWFRDGFAVDCVLDSAATPLTFPIQCHVYLTSNTKGLSDVLNVDSRMNAEVLRDGTIKVTKFYLGQDPPAREWEH
jgi:hypothetical protein